MHGIIGNITDDAVREVMKWFISRALSEDIDPLYLLINSGGGGVGSSFALIDLLLTSKANHRLHTIALGQASSMAIPLFLCGSRRIIGPRAKMMFHHLGRCADKDERWVAEQMLHTGEDIKRSEHLYGELLAEKSQVSRLLALSFFKDERVVYAEEAVELGIAHEILSRENSIF